MKKTIIDLLLKKSLSIMEKNSTLNKIKRSDVHRSLGREFRFDRELSKMIIRELKRNGSIKNMNRNIVIKKRREVQR